MGVHRFHRFLEHYELVVARSVPLRVVLEAGGFGFFFSGGVQRVSWAYMRQGEGLL
jgi:hypothetical protein